MLILFSGAWSAGEIGALIALGALIGIANGALLVLLIIVNIIFYFLLKKPTLKGRKLLDKAEGFKQYLKVAEQEELNLKYPPRKTPNYLKPTSPLRLHLKLKMSGANNFLKCLVPAKHLAIITQHGIKEVIGIPATCHPLRILSVIH